MGGDNGVARARGAERTAHHGGVGGERTAAYFDGLLAKGTEVVSFEDLEGAAVHVLDRGLGHR